MGCEEIELRVGRVKLKIAGFSGQNEVISRCAECAILEMTSAVNCWRGVRRLRGDAEAKVLVVEQPDPELCQANAAGVLCFGPTFR